MLCRVRLFSSTLRTRRENPSEPASAGFGAPSFRTERSTPVSIARATRRNYSLQALYRESHGRSLNVSYVHVHLGPESTRDSRLPSTTRRHGSLVTKPVRCCEICVVSNFRFNRNTGPPRRANLVHRFYRYVHTQCLPALSPSVSTVHRRDHRQHA